MEDLKKEAREGTDPHGGQEFKEFRRLLREGIGIRTQREFARVSGISYTHLNRLLNQEVIARPSKNTLKTMAEHMPTVALRISWYPADTKRRTSIRRLPNWSGTLRNSS